MSIWCRIRMAKSGGITTKRSQMMKLPHNCSHKDISWTKNPGIWWRKLKERRVSASFGPRFVCSCASATKWQAYRATLPRKKKLRFLAVSNIAMQMSKTITTRKTSLNRMISTQPAGTNLTQIPKAWSSGIAFSPSSASRILLWRLSPLLSRITSTPKMVMVSIGSLLRFSSTPSGASTSSSTSIALTLSARLLASKNRVMPT